jgi:thiamine-phosphate pyrophosphorylase
MKRGWKGAVRLRVDADAMTLYAVTDRTWADDVTLMEQVKQALDGGITFLQLREKKLSEEEFIKEAQEMKKLAQEYKIPFVINDNIKVALEVDADGVHIGQDDMSVQEARKLLGEDKIIGVSAHNVKEAVKAQKGGADYLGVGAVCATSTKKDANVVSKEEIKKIKEAVDIPIVAIGGIKQDNIKTLQGTGVDGVAVVSAIFAAKDITKAAKELLKAVKDMKSE